ncbi:FkbM family methyltransferase [Mycolicibacterium chubuense]|uniref:FkbM family methyltransferase n=1 Tax=Mycolicibacterium chubuense TaxID=1800 RepID=UPI001EEF1C8A|nr:FkbM family methyltransferase [Mycolicibacterium chubuense]
MLTQPSFIAAAIRYKVAAAVEHLDAIRICEPNTLIDAGANKGQFSLAFRSVRPSSTIFAFEPLPDAAGIYEQLFAGDEAVIVARTALADAAGTAEFHVADRQDSSSLLSPGTGQELAFGVRTATVMQVPVRRLDECIDLDQLTSPIFLKVDVQGAELAVFEGCDNLHLIDFIYVELSFVELYEGQPLFYEVIDYLADRGFRVRGIFNQVVTHEFGPTQVDVLFDRTTKTGRS